MTGDVTNLVSIRSPEWLMREPEYILGNQFWEVTIWPRHDTKFQLEPRSFNNNNNNLKK
jgi:hypothetical protein